VFPIFSLGSVREIHSLGKYFSVHSLGHSEYQEIHTFSALNIDSVKINTSLLMMRECVIMANRVDFTAIDQYCNRKTNDAIQYNASYKETRPKKTR